MPAPISTPFRERFLSEPLGLGEERPAVRGGTGGTPFSVDVQDNGGSSHDVFQLTIAGVLQTGDGSLSHGQVDIRLGPPPTPGP